MFLYINFVEHAVMTFARDIGFHFHSDVPGQHRQKQPFLFIQNTLNVCARERFQIQFMSTYLLLINFLCGQPRLDALSGFQKRLSLCHFVGVMHHDTGHVRARQQEQINETLKCEIR